MGMWRSVTGECLARVSLCVGIYALQATGSVKAAAALAEFHARRLPTGGPEGLAAQVSMFHHRLRITRAACLRNMKGLQEIPFLEGLGC